jgi:hypothetical protein
VKWVAQRFRIAFPIKRNNVGVSFTLLFEEWDCISEMLCLHLFQSRDDGERRRNNFGVSEKVAGIFSHHMTSCSDLTVTPVTNLSLYLEVKVK